MKKIYSSLFAIVLVGLLIFPSAGLFAGNKDRSGQAGASELLINPWANSAGWGAVHTSGITGVEAMFSNIAGISHTKGTEIIFSYNDWLKGSDTKVMSFGLTQKLGANSGVLGVSIMSLSFGTIKVTTTEFPEGNGEVASPQFLNINLAYGKSFSNSIYGGLNIKLISEKTEKLSATGLALDAGVQYITGEKQQIKFGVALKNVGAPMSYSGDGLSLRAVIPGHNNDNDLFTMYQGSEPFELPAALRIGASYDFYISGDMHRITAAGNFQSNSFTKDQFTLGLEYALKYYFSLRSSYTYQNGSFDGGVEQSGTLFTGLTVGASVSVPLNKEKGTGIGIDYAFRATNPYAGVHSFGLKLNF